VLEFDLARVGDRGGGGAEDRRHLVRAQHECGGRCGKGHQEHRELDEAAAADDRVDPSGEDRRGDEQGEQTGIEVEGHHAKLLAARLADTPMR
jgi:hypothetical protein